MTWRRKDKPPAQASPPAPGQTPVPGCSPPETQPPPPRRPTAPAPGSHPQPSPCPGCGASRTYTVVTWQCDRTHLYDGAGLIGGVTPCQPDRPDLFDLEIRDFWIRELGQ